MANNGWSEERKEKQRNAIQLWAPWKKSTGPRTAEGKKVVAMNALRTGEYSRAMVEARLATSDKGFK